MTQINKYMDIHIYIARASSTILIVVFVSTGLGAWFYVPVCDKNSKNNMK